MEYSPFGGPITPHVILKKNTNKYVDFIKQAAEQVIFENKILFRYYLILCFLFVLG